MSFLGVIGLGLVAWPVLAYVFHAVQSEVDPDYRGVRVIDGRLCVDGLAVFGDLYPRLGVIDMPCHRNGEPFAVIGDGVGYLFTRRALNFEWGGRGHCVVFGDIRSAD